MASLIVENVSVEFPIYGGGSRSLKKSLLRMGSGGRICRDSSDRFYVEALRDVSLCIDDGDRLGVVGHNGAGKTTLLRVLAGVYEPVRGTSRCQGHVSALLSATLGMDAEATGYENILLRGLLLRLSPRDTRAMIDEIAEFTELGDYLAMPVHTYSSGMRLRLALAVTTCFDPEILLMDEWIGMGDAHFIEKAQSRIERFVDRASILVIASHSDALIKRLCNKAVLLDHGNVAAVGPVDEVLNTYKTTSTPPAERTTVEQSEVPE